MVRFRPQLSGWPRTITCLTIACGALPLASGFPGMSSERASGLARWLRLVLGPTALPAHLGHYGKQPAKYLPAEFERVVGEYDHLPTLQRSSGQHYRVPGVAYQHEFCGG